MKTILSVLLITLISIPSLLSAGDISSSEISGKIFDLENQETLPFSTIEVKQNGVFLMASTADVDGKYSIKPIDAGTYDLTFRFVGYEPVKYEGVVVSTGIITFLDVGLNVNTKVVGPTATVIATRIFEKPLIEIDKIPGALFIPSEIEKMPYTNPNDIISQSASIYQPDIGEPIQVRGSRPGSTLYILDGMKVTSFDGIPSSAIDQLQVITGGIPAKYGDTTSGVIILNTK